MTDRELMTLALETARTAGGQGEVPVGAVLEKDGRVLCAFGNRREADCDPTAHAEMLCLREAGRLLGSWRLTGCTLYVTSEPCPMCAGALRMSRISRVVWGTPDPAAGCCGSVYDLPADPGIANVPAVEWQGGLMAGECAGVLREFFAVRRE